MNLLPRGMGDAPAVPIQLYREWRVFEGLLMECLAELGCTIVPRPSRPGGVDPGAGLAIHAHATRRDIDGDLYYKQMHLRNLFTIDTEGWGADHSAMRSGPDFEWVDPDAAAAFCAGLARGFLATGISKDRQPPIGSGDELPDEFIFVPTQLRTDYVNIHHSPISVPDFIRTVAAWGEDRGQSLVIKIHPSGRNDPEVNDAVDYCRREFGRAVFADANVHELITRSAGVITINSGVGFESLIHGRPVATFGDCDYRWATFNATAATLDEAREHIHGFTPAALRRQQQFIYHYCNHHAYSIDAEHWWRSKARLGEYLEGVMARERGGVLRAEG
jgi:hypothetical protein